MVRGKNMCGIATTNIYPTGVAPWTPVPTPPTPPTPPPPPPPPPTPTPGQQLYLCQPVGGAYACQETSDARGHSVAMCRAEIHCKLQATLASRLSPTCD